MATGDASDPPALIPKKTDLCRDGRGATQFGRLRRVVERKPDTGAAARRIISPAASSTMIPLLSIIRWFLETPRNLRRVWRFSFTLSSRRVICSWIILERVLSSSIFYFFRSDRVANPAETCSISRRSCSTCFVEIFLSLLFRLMDKIARVH